MKTMIQCHTLHGWQMRTNHHHYWSDNEEREAIVFRYDGDPAWYVEFRDNNRTVEERKMETNGVLHSERYAEDAAENWALYVIT